MRCYGGNSTHMQPIEIQHMESQRTMHVDKPQRPRLSHAMNKLHLTFSLTFSTNYNIQEASLFPRVNTNQNFLPYFSLFSLKEIARSSLKSLLSNSRVHTLKKDKAHLVSSFYSFKATRIVKNTLPFFPTGPTPKERKTLNSPLPFTPTSPAATRISFNSS